jgi:hypothetical protein
LAAWRHEATGEDPLFRRADRPDYTSARHESARSSTGNSAIRARRGSYASREGPKGAKEPLIRSSTDPAAGKVACRAPGGEAKAASYLRNSGEIRLGMNTVTCGNRMVSASTPSIGISMIITSLSTKVSFTLAIAQEINRHNP